MEPLQSHTSNPFVGLNAFAEQHSKLFKGREDIIELALHKLHLKAQREQPFLLLLGNSGAGKSSLLNAGILPALSSSTLFPDINQWHVATIHPCDLEIDPIQALVSALAGLTDFPLLEIEQLASTVKLCREQPGAFIEQLQRKKQQLPPDQNVAISICQLERLFINEQLSENDRRVFIDLIVGLTSQCGVFVLATMRSDFYHRIPDYAGLLWLKQNGGQLDVLPPNLEQLRIMVTHAQLKFEAAREDQLALDDYIVQRAFTFPNSLPLMQFTLKHLYDNRSQNGIINYSIYRKIGGMERAIATISEHTFEKLESSEKRYFPRIANRLVIKSETGNYERRWVKREDLLKNCQSDQLLEAFIAIGVFSQHINNNNDVYVALSHDCLFSHWQRLQETLDSHHKVLALKQNLDAQADEWKSANRSTSYLLTPGKALNDGKLLLKYGGSLSSKLRALINASIRRAAILRRAWIVGLVIMLMAFGFTINNAYNAKIDKNLAENKLAESLGLIEFLINEESGQLDKIQRLDIMNNVADRSFDYLDSVDTVDDSTSAKQSRSQTFFQIGKVFAQSGRYEDAIKTFERTLGLKNELVGIHPNSFDYQLELATTNYWLANTYLRTQDPIKGEQYFLLYQKNAFDLVELRPDSAKAKVELSRAYFNLAKIAADRDQRESAAQNFLEAVKFAEKGSNKTDLQGLLNMAYAYGWLADKYQSELKMSEMIDMVKGENRTRGAILKRNSGDRYQLDAAISSWELAKLYLLLGQTKFAENILEELRQKSTEMILQNSDDSRWQFVYAFSLAELGHAEVQNGNLENAHEMFQKSFEAVSESQEITLEEWGDAFFERQYWYARMLHEQGKVSAYDEAVRWLNRSNEEVAKKWRKRAANLKQQTVEETLIAADLISHPQALIADIEYASIHQDVERLQRLMQEVPQELWTNSDLEKMRSALRKQIREINAD